MLERLFRIVMSTVLEIEKAIESLPSAEMQKLFAWMQEKQEMIEAVSSMFSMYDDEEGEGDQWHE
jgi:hypothetical protein